MPLRPNRSIVRPALSPSDRLFPVRLRSALFASPMPFANRPKRSARTREGPRCKRFMGAHDRPVKEAPGRTVARGAGLVGDRPVSEALADRQGAQAAAAAWGSDRLARVSKRPACLDRSPSCRKRALSGLCLALRPRRGGRVVECTALEILFLPSPPITSYPATCCAANISREHAVNLSRSVPACTRQLGSNAVANCSSIVRPLAA